MDAGGPRDVAGVLLTPGAGASRDNRTLVALAEALAPLPVRRVDFPYRQRGSRMPDLAVAVPYVREQVTDLAAEALGVATDRLLIGGLLYGGRMCSMAVADGLAVAGLLLLSYPLHPPGKPDRLRTEHLPAITVPTLAVSGRTDPFGSPDELRRELAALGGPWRLELVDGPHDPKDPQVVAAVRAWLG